MLILTGIFDGEIIRYYAARTGRRARRVRRFLWTQLPSYALLTQKSHAYAFAARAAASLSSVRVINGKYTA